LHIALAELNEVLLELEIPQESIRVVGGVVDNPTELRPRGTGGEGHQQANHQQFLLHRVSSFLSLFQRFEAMV
jgi:hypothetical protein